MPGTWPMPKECQDDDDDDDDGEKSAMKRHMADGFPV